MSKVNEASVLFKWTTVSMKFKFIKCSLNNISQYVSMSVPVRSPRTPSSKYELQSVQPEVHTQLESLPPL